MTDTQSTAGWYQDPSGADALRWWDGANWTGQVRPKDAPPPSGVSSWVLPSPTSAPARAAPRRRPAVTAENPAPPAEAPADPEAAAAAYQAAIARLGEREKPRPNAHYWISVLGPLAYFTARDGGKRWTGGIRPEIARGVLGGAVVIIIIVVLVFFVSGL